MAGIRHARVGQRLFQVTARVPGLGGGGRTGGAHRVSQFGVLPQHVGDVHVVVRETIGVAGPFVEQSGPVEAGQCRARCAQPQVSPPQTVQCRGQHARYQRVRIVVLGKVERMLEQAQRLVGQAAVEGRVRGSDEPLDLRLGGGPGLVQPPRLPPVSLCGDVVPQLVTDLGQ